MFWRRGKFPAGAGNQSSSLYLLTIPAMLPQPPRPVHNKLKNKRSIYLVQTVSKKGLLYSLNAQLYNQDSQVSLFLHVI